MWLTQGISLAGLLTISVRGINPSDLLVKGLNHNSLPVTLISDLVRRPGRLDIMPWSCSGATRQNKYKHCLCGSGGLALLLLNLRLFNSWSLPLRVPTWVICTTGSHRSHCGTQMCQHRTITTPY